MHTFVGRTPLSRTVRIALVVLVALGLSLAPTTPSQAAGSMSFVGTMQAAPGLGWPAFGSPVNGAWSLRGDGVGASTGGGGSGYINLAGDLHADNFGTGAFCGVSGASDGTGEVVFPPHFQVTDFGWLTGGPGGVISGRGNLRQGGVVVGRMEMEAYAPAPTPGVAGSGSCPSGTATSFLVAGTVTYTGSVR